jgi:hypothetical protein
MIRDSCSNPKLGVRYQEGILMHQEKVVEADQVKPLSSVGFNELR